MTEQSSANSEVAIDSNAHQIIAPVQAESCRFEENKSSNTDGSTQSQENQNRSLKTDSPNSTAAGESGNNSSEERKQSVASNSRETGAKEDAYTRFCNEKIKDLLTAKPELGQDKNRLASLVATEWRNH